MAATPSKTDPKADKAAGDEPAPKAAAKKAPKVDTAEELDSRVVIRGSYGSAPQVTRHNGFVYDRKE